MQPEELFSISGARDGTQTMINFNKPALAEYMKNFYQYDEYMTMSDSHLTVRMLEGVLAKEFWELSDEENVEPKAILLSFIANMAIRFGLTDEDNKTDLIAKLDNAFELSDTLISIVTQNENGNIQAAINPQIGSILNNDNVIGDPGGVCHYGIEAFHCLAATLAADQIRMGYDTKEVLDHLMSSFADSMNNEIPGIEVKAGNGSIDPEMLN